MFGLDPPLVECPTCDGWGKYEDDDEDFGSTDQFGRPKTITCGTCGGDCFIFASDAPDYEPPTLEEELDRAFAELRARLARRIQWHALSGQLSLSVRLTDSLCWSRLVAFHQHRILSDPYSHQTTLWALWTIAQQGPSSKLLNSDYLVPDETWPGLHH